MNAELYRRLGLFEGLTDISAREDLLVESLSEDQHSLVQNLAAFSHTNHMLRADQLKDIPDEFRLAGRDKHKVQLDSILGNDFLYLLAANQMTLSALGFEEKKVSIVFQLLIIVAHSLGAVLDSVAANMQGFWLPLEHVDEAFVSGHLPHKVKASARASRLFFDDVRLFDV